MDLQAKREHEDINGLFLGLEKAQANCSARAWT
jgi:hypothetical protein